MSIERILSVQLHDKLTRQEEFALLDVREEGVYYRGHLLAASNLPVARLEIAAPKMVPRTDAEIVLCDDGDGLAEWAAARLESIGYADIRVLDGGVRAWTAAGFALFDGMHVPSKAFGELVHERRHTPSLTPEQLHEQMQGERKPFLIDCRPIPEYTAWRLPGAVDLPGVELAYRLECVGVARDRPIVVNCAGRTRSIIATQTLIDLGLGDNVSGLKNGLMGWRLAGYESADGDPFQGSNPTDITVELPTVTEESIRSLSVRIERLARQEGLQRLDEAGFRRLQSQWSDRTVYLMDVRTPDEYTAEHHPDAVSAPGGQLIQETDRYLGVRNAVVLLTDDDGARATLTAIWLKRMGWRDVFVFPNVAEDCRVREGHPQPTAPRPSGTNWIEADKVAKRMRSSDAPTILDLSLSTNHEAAHIPGAIYATRQTLASHLTALPLKDIVLVCEDGTAAQLVAGDGLNWGGRRVFVLRGGMASWTGNGLPTESGPGKALVEPDDRWWQPKRHPDGASGFMRAYLSWEVGLVDRVFADGTIQYAMKEQEA